MRLSRLSSEELCRSQGMLSDNILGALDNSGIIRKPNSIIVLLLIEIISTFLSLLLRKMAAIWNFVVSRCEVTNRETLEPLGSLKRRHFLTDHLPNFRLSQVAQDFSNPGPALAEGKISYLYIFF